jgi:hypothetical protein
MRKSPKFHIRSFHHRYGTGMVNGSAVFPRGSKRGYSMFCRRSPTRYRQYNYKYAGDAADWFILAMWLGFWAGMAVLIYIHFRGLSI